MRKNKGFTLLELLVVISIIGLLLAILTPSLQKAKERARFIVCKSNFKTYGIAVAMYLQSNKDAFPHPCYSLYTRDSFTPNHPFQCRWHDSDVTPDGPLWPYVQNKNASFCPTFAGIAKNDGQFHIGHIASIPVRPQFTYSMNGYLSAGDNIEPLGNADGYRMAKLTNVKVPSKVMLLTEEDYWTMNTGYERTTPYINYNVTNDSGAVINLSYYGLNDMYFMPSKYGSSLSEKQGDCIATFHRAADTRHLTGISGVLFNDSHVGEEKAYDGETAAGTVRRSWQLATGKID
jgi:prepilin-type N-terminal cleavage/methylation domain-containing protein